MQKFLEETRLSRWQADVVLLFVTLIWGWSFYAVKTVVDVYPVFSFLSIRFALALLVLLPFVWRRISRLPWTQIRPGLLSGIFLFGGYSLQTVGLRYTSISNSGLITGLYVVLVPIFAMWVMRQPPQLNALVGLGFATGGLVLLTVGPSMSIGLGDTLTLLGAVAYAAHVTSVSKFGGKVEVLVYSFIQIAVVMTGSVMMAFVWEGGLALAQLTADVFHATLLMAVLVTALVLVLQAVSQKFTSPTHVAVVYTMEPVFAAMFGYLLAGDRLSPGALLGGGLIFAGMLLAEVGGPLFKKPVRKSVLDAGG